MAVVPLPAAVIKDLAEALGGAQPAKLVDRRRLMQKPLTFLPRNFDWNPEVFLLGAKHAFLIHPVVSAEIPDWVIKPMRHLKGDHRRSKLVILVRRPDSGPVWKIAAKLTDICATLKAGLAVETSDGAALVFPPDFTPPPKCKSRSELGHIPSWILERLLSSTGFSPYLTKCFGRFTEKYGSATSKKSISYDDEQEILLDFAKDVKRGDSRVFMPLGSLHVLAEAERLRNPKTSRDHFFHTFNNLFLGFLILSDLFSNRKPTEPPDRYIRDTTRQSRLAPWEVLWSLTCLFHDPGYIAENIWLTVSYAYGFPNQLSGGELPPEQIREQLLNAWDSLHSETSGDLVSLFQRVRSEGSWIPARLERTEISSFRGALQKSYFDGQRVGHSLQSGLHLINYCVSDETTQCVGYNPKTALTACEIAALSMMFHDQHCREVMSQAGVNPLAFEHLPYASVLMFVDALQDDRRDIKKDRFPKHGVLENVQVFTEMGQKAVRARVCLPELPLSWWPGKIEEYESVMRWINSTSKTKFMIDYRTEAWK